MGGSDIRDNEDCGTYLLPEAVEAERLELAELSYRPAGMVIDNGGKSRFGWIKLVREVVDQRDESRLMSVWKTAKVDDLERMTRYKTRSVVQGRGSELEQNAVDK